ncbi:11S globulin seed storage protein 1-like [Cornus florida]|uniref:11S globulin seed storage protein 1-like n=1 Tax=Cornus florida TaxID=4283 RepID=UPI0028A1A3D0|nr:11S globulin seed storage protein 1-like [Cornus florida]
MTTSSSLLTVTLCILLICHGSQAQIAQRQSSRSQQQQQGECRVQNLNPLDPVRRYQHEAGVTEEWDQNTDQLQCAGVAATRHVIDPRGLLLPSFNNAPMLAYVLQGQGLLGMTCPGCPETYQSFQQTQEGRSSQRSMDQHQKVRRIRQGDIVALPAGIAHWCYNDGNNHLVLVVVHDTNNDANQLDQRLRRFFIAGNQQEQQPRSLYGQQQRPFGHNIFQAFNVEILAEAFNVDPETARKLQNENDRRGNIVRVEKGLQLVRPRFEEEEEEERREERERGRYNVNGLEETICSMRIRENIANPERADVYSARGGRISTVNSHNLPILRYLQLSAERGNLYRNAMVAPLWNINAHSVLYVIRGNAHIQISGNSQRPAFDGEVREGQLLIVPQNFAVVKRARDQGFEWISFKTNDLAKTSPLAGRTSVVRAMPEEVLMNAYQVSRDEARRLKYNRQEVTILSPRSTSSRGQGPYTE